MIGIFLDDIRVPEQISYSEEFKAVKWIVVRDYDNFMNVLHELLLGYDYFVVSFDHDLSDFNNGNERTGLTYLKSMCNMIESMLMTDMYHIKCVFHSDNPIGVNNMESYWGNWENNVGVKANKNPA